MARNTKKESTSAPQPEAPTTVQHVRIVNQSRTPLNITLKTGGSVTVGPRIPGKDIHISKPILRKHIPQPVRRMEKRGIVRLEPVPGGETNAAR